MAESVRGINVVIGADTTRLGQALSDVESKSKSIQQELRQVERLLKFDPSNTTLLAQKQQLLAQQIENTSEKLNRLKSVQQQVNEQFQRGEISEGQYRAFQREIEKTEGQLRSLQSRLDETNGAIKQNASTWGQLQEKLNAIGQRAQEVGQRMQAVGQELAMSFGAATLAIGGALGIATKKSMDFEAQLSSIKSVSGATGQQMEQLKNLAIEMGAKTKYSGLEAAQGIEELIKAGVSLEDIMKGGLEGALSLATAGELDLAEAAEIASTALNAFKADSLSVSDAANLLAGGANASATSVKELKYGLSQVSAVAAGLGLSFKDTTTALALFANNGLKGSDAGTSLKTMLSNLIPKSDAAAGMMKELGIITKDGANSFFDANGNIKSMADIAGILQNALKGLNAEQRQNALYTMFGSDAIRAANILYKEGADGIKKMYSEMSKVTAAQVAEEKMNNLKGRIEELKGAFETAQITIGNALTPAIDALVKALQGLVDWFNNLSPATQQFVAIGTAVVAALMGIVATFGVVLAVIGSAVTGFGALVSVFPGILTGLAAIRTAFAVMTGPIGLAVAALVAAGVAIYQNWDTIKAKAIEIWGSIREWFNSTLDGIKQFFETTWIQIGEFVISTWESIKQVTTTVWNAIKDAVITILNPFITVVTNLFNGMKNGLQMIFEGLKQYFSGVWELIKNIFLGAVLLIVDLVTGDFEGLKNDAKAIFDNLKNALQSIWEGIKLVFSGALEVIKGFVNAAWENVKSNTSIVFNAVKSTISSIWEGIKSFFFTTVENIKTTISNGFENMKNAVSEKMTAAKSKIEEIWNQAKSFLEGINLYEIGKNIIQGLIDGISSMASALWEKAKEIADMVKNTIRDALDINSPSRVMRDEVGKWIPIGLAEGINRNINAVVSATNRMVRATIPNVTGYSSAGIPATATINVPKMAGAKIENHFHFHSTAPTPSEVARKTRQVSRQLAMEWGL
ncbi:phage tail tape measure protein [Anoxybacillus sp. FSL W8-0104]|uniref:phage tail tape measure protein n=1 Tax=Anoxybacillus sp. FSL W8-0104 TaxID=2954594 RepID=UPI0030F73DCA